MTISVEITDVQMTAYHETGHAVAAALLGIPFRYVTIRPRTPGHLGLCNIRAGSYSVWDLAMELHAGPIACARMVWIAERRDVLVEEYKLGGLSDSVKLYELVEGDEDPDGFWEESQQQAHGLLVRRWNLVEKVAIALMERKTLTATEIKDIWWSDMARPSERNQARQFTM